jgi:hypothetical protein
MFYEVIHSAALEAAVRARRYTSISKEGIPMGGDAFY